jgi:hypothetical protein
MRTCKIVGCKKPLPPNSSGGRRYCDDCKRAKAKAEAEEERLAEQLDDRRFALESEIPDFDQPIPVNLAGVDFGRLRPGQWVRFSGRRWSIRRGFRLGFRVAGVSFGDAQELVRKHVRPCEPLRLVREPANPHDPNAIAVQLPTGQPIGHVPRGKVTGLDEEGEPRTLEELARLLDAGAKWTAYCEGTTDVETDDGRVLRGVFVVGFVETHPIEEPDQDVPSAPPSEGRRSGSPIASYWPALALALLCAALYLAIGLR